MYSLQISPLIKWHYVTYKVVPKYLYIICYSFINIKKSEKTEAKRTKETMHKGQKLMNSSISKDF